MTNEIPRQLPIRVTDIVLEPATRRESTFPDPREIITEDNWQSIERYLQGLRDFLFDRDSLEIWMARLPAFVALFASARIIAPERFREFEDDYNLFQVVLDRQSYLLRDGQFGDFSEFCADSIIALGKTAQELGRGQETFGRISDSLHTSRAGSPGGLLRRAYEAAIINPELILKADLHENDWQRIKKLIEQTKRHQQQAGLDFNPVSSEAMAKVVFPQKGSELIPDLARWQTLRELQTAFRDHGGWEVLLSLTRDLTILAAHEVKSTGRGLELIMSEPSFTPPTPPPPILRKF